MRRLMALRKDPVRGLEGRRNRLTRAKVARSFDTNAVVLLWCELGGLYYISRLTRSPSKGTRYEPPPAAGSTNTPTALDSDRRERDSRSPPSNYTRTCNKLLTTSVLRRFHNRPGLGLRLSGNCLPGDLGAFSRCLVKRAHRASSGSTRSAIDSLGLGFVLRMCNL